ncbi:MAG: hypothetical protein WCF95_05975, partial [bacterium]
MSKKLYKISQDPNKNNKRIAWVRKLVLFIMLAIICKLFFLQIWDVDNLKKKASIRRQSRILNQAMRGDIVDIKGSMLVTSRCYYDIYIDPRQIRTTPDEVSSQLSPILGIPKNVILHKINNEKRTVILAKNVDITTNKKLRKLGLRCLDIIQKPGREYPQGKLAAHVLGYVN